MLLMENHLHMEARVSLIHYRYRSDQKLGPDIVAIRIIPCSCIIAQQYYLFPGIQKSKKHLISLDMVEYIISSTIKFLVVTITGL